MLDMSARGDGELVDWLAGLLHLARAFKNAGQLRQSRPGIPFPRSRGTIARILLSTINSISDKCPLLISFNDFHLRYLHWYIINIDDHFMNVLFVQ